MTEQEMQTEIESLRLKLKASQDGRASDAAAAEKARQEAKQKQAEFTKHAVATAVQEAFTKASDESKVALSSRDSEHAAEVQKLKASYDEALAKTAADHAAELSKAKAAADEAKVEASRYKALADKRREALYAARKHVTDADSELTKHINE